MTDTRPTAAKQPATEAGHRYANTFDQMVEAGVMDESVALSLKLGLKDIEAEAAATAEPPLDVERLPENVTPEYVEGFRAGWAALSRRLSGPPPERKGRTFGGATRSIGEIPSELKP